MADNTRGRSPGSFWGFEKVTCVRKKVEKIKRKCLNYESLADIKIRALVSRDWKQFSKTQVKFLFTKLFTSKKEMVLRLQQCFWSSYQKQLPLLISSDVSLSKPVYILCAINKSLFSHVHFLFSDWHFSSRFWYGGFP